MQDWPTTLATETPEQGFELAPKLSRIAVKKTQPDDDVRKNLRQEYMRDSAALIAASNVVAVNFATVAAANNYWRLP